MDEMAPYDVVKKGEVSNDMVMKTCWLALRCA